MFCKNCGIELDENAEFCAQCDKKISEESSVEKTVVITRKKWLIPVLTLALMVAIIFVLLKTSGINSSPEKVAAAIVKSEYEVDVKIMIKCMPDFVVKELAVDNGLSENASRKEVIKAIQEDYRAVTPQNVEIISTQIAGEGTTEEYTIFRELFDYLTDKEYDSIEKIAKVDVECTVDGDDVSIQVTCIKMDNKWYFLRNL